MSNLKGSQWLYLGCAGVLVVGSVVGALAGFETWTQAMPPILAGLAVFGIHPNLG